MAKMETEYHFPTSVQEAVSLLEQYGAQARVIAGGTDLWLELQEEPVWPRALIDVSRIPALRRIDSRDGKTVIGAAVTYEQLLEESSLARLPVLLQAVGQIGSVEIRNVATLVGNVVNASPAGDTLPPLYVLNAEVWMQGPGGSRQVPIERFVLGPRETALRPGEIVTAVAFDTPDDRWQGGFGKVGLRQAVVITVASTAVLIAVRDREISQARIAVGAVAPTVIRLPRVEAVLEGNLTDQSTIDRASALVSEEVIPISDVRASAAYRRRGVARLVRRTLTDVQSRIGKEE